MVSSFGIKRIISGSDSPVCNLGGGLETWVAATYLMTQDWSNEEKKAFSLKIVLIYGIYRHNR